MPERDQHCRYRTDQRNHLLLHGVGRLHRRPRRRWGKCRFGSSECNANGGADTHPQPYAAADTDTNTNSNSNSNTNTNGNGDSDAYTRTDYSLSTITDDRPYQGS